MRYYFIVLSIICLIWDCTPKKKLDAQSAKEPQSWQVTIKGEIRYPNIQKSVYLEALGSQYEVKGTKQKIEINADGTYEKRMIITQPGYFRINFYDVQQVLFIVYRDDLEINVDGNNPSGFVEIKGSPDMDFLDHIKEITNTRYNSAEIKSLNEEFAKARQLGQADKIANLQNRYADLIAKSYPQIDSAIRRQGPSLAVINLLSAGNVIDVDQYFDTYLYVADLLQKEWPAYEHSQEFIAKVTNMKNTAIGQLAPEIALPNPQGETVRLSSLRGKYVLIDFWAKWCGPCRQENPNIVRMYHLYKDRNFEVFGVSLDRNKEDWLKGIREDGLVWPQVSDLQYFNSEAAVAYNVTAIPFSILIDPQGVILAKNLRGRKLQETLANLLDKL